jgi:hypothetical protein
MNAPLLLVLSLAAGAPARAQAGPAARIAAFVERTPEMSGAAFPTLDSIPVPRSAPAAAPSASAESIVPTWLWATLKAPDAAALAALSSRIPDLKASTVRVLSIGDADALLAAAVRQGLSPLDFFTDPGFRGDAAFFLDQETLATLFARYDIRGLTPASGTTKDGKPFMVRGMVVGGGRIDILYNLDRFSFDNPGLPGHVYKLADHVVERIQGPGDLTLEGIWVHFGWLTPKLSRILRLSPAKCRVETNHVGLEKPVFAIRRR